MTGLDALILPPSYVEDVRNAPPDLDRCRRLRILPTTDVEILQPVPDPTTKSWMIRETRIHRRPLGRGSARRCTCAPAQERNTVRTRTGLRSQAAGKMHCSGGHDRRLLWPARRGV